MNRMYYGIMENEGKRVSDHDAFSYACEMVQYGDNSLKNEFMQIAVSSKSFEEFARRTVEWFFSGSYIHSF